MNACPFCPTNNGNLLHEDLEGNLEALVAGGCPDFPKKMN
jgi:hypothetical protein